MSAPIQHDEEQSATTLEDELHELEDQERALERRTGSLELAGWLTMIFSIIAFAIALAALVVVLGDKDSRPDGVAREAVSRNGGTSSGAVVGSSAQSGPMMGSSSASHSGMMGVGGHGSFKQAEVAAAERGIVYVQLGDYWAAPTVRSVKAGKVTFVAKNVGRVPHELMVERSPIKFDAPMKPNEDAAQGMIDDMSAGQSGRMTVKLSPGTYVLFCNAPGHYMLGQHIVFKVAKS